MRKIVICLSLVLYVSSSQAGNCRNAIVAAYDSLGVTIDANSFSNAQFSDLSLSVAEFNALSSEKQEAIYLQVKPIEVMIEESIANLNKKISQIAGSFYEFFMIDELQNWREKRDQLRSCQ